MKTNGTIREEDKPWNLWQRNVVDKYKSISNEEIKRDLKETALPCAVLMAQIEGDFNFSNVVRTSNFFNLECIYYYGRKHFDRRGTTGTHLYSDVKYLTSFSEIKDLKNRYTFVGFENNIDKATININNYKFPNNPLIIIGEEGNGIQPELIELCDQLVEIKNYGSVRSLNAATVAAIAINLLSSQFRR
jgi:tRNA G18 (ribose-2'-O)-methylase SpoU